MNLGVVVFQGGFRLKIGYFGCFIGLWVMKGAQEVGSGTKGLRGERWTLTDGLVGFLGV